MLWYLLMSLQYPTGNELYRIDYTKSFKTEIRNSITDYYHDLRINQNFRFILSSPPVIEFFKEHKGSLSRFIKTLVYLYKEKNSYDISQMLVALYTILDVDSLCIFTDCKKEYSSLLTCGERLISRFKCKLGLSSDPQIFDIRHLQKSIMMSPVGFLKVKMYCGEFKHRLLPEIEKRFKVQKYFISKCTLYDTSIMCYTVKKCIDDTLFIQYITVEYK